MNATAYLRMKLIGNRFAFRRQRSEALRTAGVLLAILGLYGIVGEMDYRDALATEAATARLASERAEKALTDCLNGTARWTATDGSMVACEKALEIRL